jgi:hypothetical protein
MLVGVLRPTHNRPQRAQRGSRGIALLMLDLGATRGWVFSTTPRPLYPRERPGTHCTGGWVGPRAGLDVCGIRSPDRPARSQSLTELSGPLECVGYESIFLPSKQPITWRPWGPKRVCCPTYLSTHVYIIQCFCFCCFSSPLPSFIFVFVFYYSSLDYSDCSLTSLYVLRLLSVSAFLFMLCMRFLKLGTWFVL